MNYNASEERYERMKYNRCGKSGLKLPEVSLGFWHNFGTDASYTNMKQMCFTAFDHGITHFDLANNYGPPYGTAEETLGQLIKEDFKPYRDELFISTKAAYPDGKNLEINRLSREEIEADADKSLKALGMQ